MEEVGELIGFSRIIRTVNATSNGGLIFDGGGSGTSYLVSCIDGGFCFNFIVISSSGNIKFNIINVAIRTGYSIYIDGTSARYLKIKSDGIVEDKQFTFIYTSLG